MMMDHILSDGNRRQGRLGGRKSVVSRRTLYIATESNLPRPDRSPGQVYPGQPEAIIDADLWQPIQGRLAGNRQARALGETAVAPSLLAGLILDGNKNDRRYRYYVTIQLISGTRADHAKGVPYPRAISRCWSSIGYAHSSRLIVISVKRCHALTSTPLPSDVGTIFGCAVTPAVKPTTMLAEADLSAASPLPGGWSICSVL
jgi:hypothetical protein